MPYFGSAPPENALEADDIASNAVTTAKIANDAVDIDKINLVSTSSAPSLEAKGTSGQTEGYIQLNCAENSHGIKLKSPPHSAAQSYTLTFPSAIVDGGFMKTDSSGNLSFAAAGGLNLITATTADGDSSIAFTSGIDSTYEVYMVKGVNIHVSNDDVYIKAVVGTSGPSYITSGVYDWIVEGSNEGGTSNTDRGDGDSSISLHKNNGSGEMIGNATGENADFEFIIHAPAATDNYKKFFIRAVTSESASGVGVRHGHGGGQIKNTSAYTAIKFEPSAGTFTTGNFYLYGLSKS